MSVLPTIETTENKPIRVLQVFASLGMGGAESRMMDVYRNIDRENYVFDFLCMQQGEQYYEPEIRSMGGCIIKIDPPRASGAYGNFRAIRKVLRDGRYDAVHAHTSFHCGIVMLAAWLEKVPARISHARTAGSKNHSLKNKIALWLGRILISLFSTERFAVSSEAGRYLFGKKAYKVIPNAIDCKKYMTVQPETIEKLKEKYDIPKDAACIGMVGRFESMKNHEFAIKLFSQFLRERANAVLFLVGDGPLRAKTEILAKELNVEKQVIFTGIQLNVNEWMNLFDLLLLPSKFEGLPGVVLEAEAAGTPVVKSDSVTNSVDIGLGLIRSVSLEDNDSVWLEAIKEMLTKRVDDKDVILDAFFLAGFSIDAELRELERVYNG